MSEDLLSELSKKYSIPLDRLLRSVTLDREIVGLYNNKDDIYGAMEASVGREVLKLPDEDSTKLNRSLAKAPSKHYLHYPIYGDNIVRVKTGKIWQELKVDEFIAKFPDLILFLVPLYNAYEYNGEIKQIQEALRKFAVAFGRRVGSEVLVFDYWTNSDFEPEQYDAQQHNIASRMKIPLKKLPALLVANRSPFAWDPSDESGKCVVLTFRGIKESEVGLRLAQIETDLKKLRLPSKWEHDWSRFKNWANAQGLLGAIIGAALGG